MFAIHYLFNTSESIDNLVNNINLYLKVGGFIVLTLFDATQVSKLLNGAESYASYFTDDNGQKTKLFEITKKFTGPIKDEPGQTIGVFMKWLNQNELPENIVTSKLMCKTMERAGCSLIESDLFENIYNINKSWFKDVVPSEENFKNKKYYEDVAKFYENLKGADKESKSYSFLNRYYIFQKRE